MNKQVTKKNDPVKEDKDVVYEESVPDGVKKEKVKDSDYNLEVIKDYYGKIDPFYLAKKNPEYMYRFLRDDKKNLSMKTSNMLFSKGGWQICSKEHLVKIGIADRFIGPDGHYRVGDTVLAFMPKKLYDEKEEQKRLKANEPMDQIDSTIKHGDPTNPELAGTGHRNMKGLQTPDQMGMR